MEKFSFEESFQQSTEQIILLSIYLNNTDWSQRVACQRVALDEVAVMLVALLVEYINSNSTIAYRIVAELYPTSTMSGQNRQVTSEYAGRFD